MRESTFNTHASTALAHTSLLSNEFIQTIHSFKHHTCIVLRVSSVHLQGVPILKQADLDHCEKVFDFVTHCMKCE